MAATGTPWFKLFSQLRSHPKLEDLAEELHIPKAHAIGHLVTLWCWVTDYRPDGKLDGCVATRIEGVAEWTGEPGAFVAALARCRWIRRRRGRLSGAQLAAEVCAELQTSDRAPEGPQATPPKTRWSIWWESPRNQRSRCGDTVS